MKDKLKDKKLLGIGGMFLLILLGIIFLPSYAGALLILSLIVFGSLCLMWKESHIKLAGLAFLLILAIAHIGFNGLKYGIDFDGGTRIPVILERPATSEEMDELIQAINVRVRVLGLTEAKVRAIGDSQINVELASSDEGTIRHIEDTLSHKGVYWGVIDGRIAVSGEDIYSTSISPLSGQQITQQGADWGVQFSVNRHGAEQFAEVAKGKADYPVNMFLDRPDEAVLFISRAELVENMPEDSSEREATKALTNSLKLDQERDIPVYIIEDMGAVPAPKTNKTKALIFSGAPESIKSSINDSGYILREFEKEEITPTYDRSRAGVLHIGRLEAVGLLSAPLLSSGLAEGIPNYGFSISGSVPGEGTEKAKSAKENEEKIESILKGGSLPVQISLGSRTTLPASLGEEFLRLSLIGIVGALIAISLLIGLRYRNVKATLPIIAISITELIILLAILGSFTIDLAAMAGIIAAIGVGVDAQIVITDEILKKSEETDEERIGHAFAIIKTNVIVASLSMAPLLLFSNLVEIIGFATATVLGSLLGYMLSRPAYAAIVEMIIGKRATIS